MPHGGLYSSSSHVGGAGSEADWYGDRSPTHIDKLKAEVGDVWLIAHKLRQASKELAETGNITSLNFGFDQGQIARYPGRILLCMSEAYKQRPMDARANEPGFCEAGENLGVYIAYALRQGKDSEILVNDVKRGITSLWDLNPPAVGPTLPILKSLVRNPEFLLVARSVVRGSTPEFDRVENPHLSWFADLAVKSSRVMGEAKLDDAVECLGLLNAGALNLVPVYLGKRMEDGNFLEINRPYLIYSGYMAAAASLFKRLGNEKAVAGGVEFKTRTMRDIADSAKELMSLAKSKHTPDFALRGAVETLKVAGLRETVWPELRSLVNKASVDGLYDLLDCVEFVAEQDPGFALNIAKAVAGRLCALSRGAESVNEPFNTSTDCLYKLISNLGGIAKNARLTGEVDTEKKLTDELKDVFSTLARGIDFSTRAAREKAESAAFNFISSCEASGNEGLIPCVGPLADGLRNYQYPGSVPSALDLRLERYLGSQDKMVRGARERVKSFIYRVK